MKDSINIYTVEENARVYIASTKNLVQQSRFIHNTTPVVTAALGRTLTAGAIMGAMLKNDTDLLTISIKGNGPIGGIVVTADNKSCVKGYVHNNKVQIPLKPTSKLDVAGAIGTGTITVTKDISLKHPISGSLELVSSEIAEDITYYFAKSEQIPSVVGLGVLVDTDFSVLQAGGFIVQLLPGAKEEFITTLEDSLTKLPSVTKMLSDGQPVLTTLFPNQKFRYHGEITPSFTCNCSRERTQKALVSVGKIELQAILDEDKGAKIHCHFCNTDYDFSEEDIRELL